MRLPSMPETAALSDVWAITPHATPELMAYVDALLRGPGPLDLADRELIAAFVSAGNACQFCYGSHLIFAEAFGIEPGLIEALVHDLDTADVPDRLRVLLRYVKRLHSMPPRLVQSDADAVLAAGWSEAALVDAVRIAGLFHMMNRIVEGTGVNFDTLGARDAHPTAALGENARTHRYVPAGGRP